MAWMFARAGEKRAQESWQVRDCLWVKLRQKSMSNSQFLKYNWQTADWDKPRVSVTAAPF